MCCLHGRGSVFTKMMCSISRSFGSYGLKSYTETSRPRTSRPKWKLSDFVLAKYSPMRETSYFSTEIMGTFGYAAPEYESTAAAVYKVYSIAARMLADFQESINFYDADEWFLSQSVEEEIVNLQVGSQEVDTEQWRGPQRDGTTFVGCHLKDEAKLITILWAVESMTSQRVKNVIFKGEFKEFFEAINKPGAWPAFSFQGMEVMTALSGCQGINVLEGALMDVAGVEL
ncbi:hypothetical protein HID58_066728 [Brassica napus]|uniref:Uncharacterized protein n=1 Tax=Brassica napus TaxID=3708 RepID=A0ABQ7ZGI2_BRANA|nr:hypothetical protein HID58_066728 [Brassica napus]